jgi:signal peptidase I
MIDFEQPQPAEHSAEPDEYVRQPTSYFVREIIETLLLTLLIFWVVNTMTGRFRIEGQSMEPTLHEGEYVLVNKLAYYLGEPERGDIIVMHHSAERDFIKRIIGLPGDQVVINDNHDVLINGVKLNEPYLNGPPPTTGSWTVPEGSFFVMGDNRPNSSDSRSWGFLEGDQIAGKATAIYWPLSDMQWAPHYDHTYVELGTTQANNTNTSDHTFSASDVQLQGFARTDVQTDR